MAKQSAKTATPRLRFPEFMGAPSWSEKVLGDEGEFLSPLTGKTAQHFGAGSAKYVTYMNVFANTLTDMATLGVVDVETGESQNAVEPGDVLFTVSSETPEEVGMSSVVIDAVPNCYVNSFCAMFRFNDGNQPNLRFLGYSLRQPFARHHLVKRAQGSTRFNLSKPAFRSLPLLLPVAAEQQKIADCLTSLDEVIAAQGRKVEAMKAHKRGLMQQLFPREGETRPRLRFPEFRNAPEWRNVVLGDVSTIVRGGSPRPINDFLTVEPDGLNWLKIGDVDREAKYITATQEKVRVEALSKTRVISPGDFILSNSMSFGRPYISAIDACIHDGWIAVTRIRKSLVHEFLYYSILSERSQTYFANQAAGSGVQNLNKDIVKLLPVAVPSEREQQLIADCLASLDTHITAETDRLAALKTHKQGLMQQLFPAAEASGA